MPRLAKNMYTANGERKLNCYNIAIPKAVAKEAHIDDTDELRIYAKYGQIIIELKYNYVCMECGLEWQSGEAYSNTTYCPRCHCGDISENEYDN